VKARTRVSFPQLGTIASLPSSTGSLKSNYVVGFSDSTGGIKKITYGSTAVDQNLVGSAGTSAAGLLEARQASIEAKAKAKDELTQLERERKILEEKKAIRDLKKELGVD